MDDVFHKCATFPVISSLVLVERCYDLGREKWKTMTQGEKCITMTQKQRNKESLIESWRTSTRKRKIEFFKSMKNHILQFQMFGRNSVYFDITSVHPTNQSLVSRLHILAPFITNQTCSIMGSVCTLAFKVCFYVTILGNRCFIP